MGYKVERQNTRCVFVSGEIYDQTMLIAKRIPIIRFARLKVDIDSLGNWETAGAKYLANLREGVSQ